MNKIDAELQAISIDEHRADVWCPISNHNCYNNCECYIKSEIRYSGLVNSDDEPITLEKDWNITAGKCMCYMLKGIL